MGNIDKLGEKTMSVVKVLRFGQITLPKEYRKTLGIETGELLEAELVDSKIILTPKSLVDKGSNIEGVQVSLTKN